MKTKNEIIVFANENGLYRWLLNEGYDADLQSAKLLFEYFDKRNMQLGILNTHLVSISLSTGCVTHESVLSCIERALDWNSSAILEMQSHQSRQTRRRLAHLSDLWKEQKILQEFHSSVGKVTVK